MVKEIERLKEAHRMYWRVYGEGEYGRMEGLVFGDWKEVSDVPPEAEFIAYGQDFGFTNDPAATVAAYRHDGAVILDEIVYKRGLTNQDLCDEYARNDISKNAEIYADGSEPKSIEEISRMGYDIRPAKKGPDSIRFGIGLMHQYEIRVTSRSVNLKKEARKYVWKKNRAGEPLNEPIDFNNHALDAVRYIFLEKLRKEEENNDTLFFIN